jgi:hypothetical protein
MDDARLEDYAAKLIYHAKKYASEKEDVTASVRGLYILALCLIANFVFRLLGITSGGGLTYLDAMVSLLIWAAISFVAQRWHLWKGEQLIGEYADECEAERK